MAAIRIIGDAYLSFSPPWGKRMLKLGRLGFEPGKIPIHLTPYLLKKGDVKPHAVECKADGNTGKDMVQCINRKVAEGRISEKRKEKIKEELRLRAELKAKKKARRS